MKTIASAVFMTALLGLSLSLQAYDVVTHEEMSERAMKASYLAKDPELLKSLGLKPLAEEQKFPNSKNTGQTIPNLFRDGTRFEDAFPRSLNHFYNPLSRTGLLFGVYIGNPSPDWALEDTATNRRQAYSLRDARDYLYNALTASKQSDRDANFGLTFQTLGQVIHHLQDMAQPQHVRNDMHLDQWELGGFNPLYNPSLYEKHTQGLGGNLPFSGYPPVTFTTARQFWTGQGRGIADFTNANFLSAGTNFRGTTAALPNENYLAPRWNGSTESITFWDLLKEEGITCAPPTSGNDDTGPVLTVSATSAPTVGVAATAALDPTLPPACQLNGPMVFYGTDVFDAHTGLSNSNQRAATLSIFDQDLEQNTLPRAFALNRFNFKAAVSGQGNPT